MPEPSHSKSEKAAPRQRKAVMNYRTPKVSHRLWRGMMTAAFRHNPQTMEAYHVPSGISNPRGDRADRRFPVPSCRLQGRRQSQTCAHKQPDTIETADGEKFDKVEIGEIEETPPAELEVDPTLEKPAQAAQGPDSGFEGRGSGSRKAMLTTGGGTKHTERAVTAALVWLANHQLYDGSWSLQNYTTRCIDKTCTGVGKVPADAGGTAMGLLPFLAAGQTHKSKGPYKEHILKGVEWLIHQQQPDGNLAKGAQQMMYSHGLATIALSEAYGLTGDKTVGLAAQGAVNFILSCPERGRRRLALQSRGRRRHFRTRLAVDGLEERKNGRAERRRGCLLGDR